MAKEFVLPDWVKPHHLAYAAGFIDADGTVTISTVGRKDRFTPVRYRPHISAAGVDRAPLDFLMSMFGGSINGSNRQKSSVRHNFIVYQWSASSALSVWIARCLEEYLIIKKTNARLLMRFQDEALWVKPRGPDQVPEEELERRRSLRNDAIMLNSRPHLERVNCVLL